MIKKVILITLTGILWCFVNSCKELPSEIVNNYYSIDDSLRNPNVQPVIMFTNPSNGAIGPFGNIDITKSSNNSRITIQLNKLINISDLKPTTVTLKSDDKILPLYLSGNYYFGYGYQDSNLRNILVFDVDTKYLAGKIYTLTVDTTLIDIHGNRLSKPFSISFTPEPKFRVTYLYPTSKEVDPQSLSNSYSYPIRISFNSRIDSSILSKTSISPTINGKWLLNIPVYSTNDSTSIVFIPNDTVPLETQYSISIASNAKDSYGQIIGSPFQYSFTTAPFKVYQNGASSGIGVGGFQIYNFIGFMFNAPADTASIKSSISIVPSISFTTSFDNTALGKQKYAIIKMNEAEFQKNTVYTIVFNTSAHSTKGNYLKEKYSYSFVTGS